MSSSIPPSTPGKPWQPPAPEDLAAELPAYEILGLLGRGGMGAVYKARQKSLNREVAIKVLPPTIEEGDMHYGERFKAEAQSMARLNHPGIVAVYDAGETPSGLLYFVMEYVQGTDVHQMIQAAGKLPPEHVYAIVANVCDALAYAHGNGLIHRDIKPANIMVDTQGRVKVADFGLAKAVDANTGFTQSNMAVGTPDFVAPEALIPGMAVDGRADLYAIGVMLYQMLTGSVPRGAWHPASVVVPGIDRRFDAIISKAMQCDREARHSSAVELRQHLDTLLMPAVPAPDLQRYSSAGMAKVAAQPPQDRRPGVATARPAASGASPGAGRAKATPGLQPEAAPAKSKTPLFIGLGAAAAIGIGAFVMLSGGDKAKQSGPLSPLSSTNGSVSSNTPQTTAQGTVRTTLPPAKAEEPKKIEPAKPESKPAVVAKAPAPPKTEPAKPTPPPAAPQETPKPAMADVGVQALADSGKPTPAPKPQTLASSATPVSPSPSLPVSSSPPLPPELATLDTQFTALQKDRVTAPYEADLAKLNTSYLGGIEKAIAAEKAAGHLDGILALENEKKLIAEKQPVPETDDASTPAALKNLRAIWRTQHAKLLTTRTAALTALVDPLDKRLAAMETDFTKADRLADAKTVRSYREALAESSRVGNDVAAAGSSGTATPPDHALAGAATKSINPAATLALKDGITNTLGMKFLPVKGTEVLFCIHEVRYKDYAAYAAETPDAAPDWKKQTHDGYALTERAEDHPVVYVSWEDAQKFCAWLSKKEGKLYRLPTDEEWSYAVGIGRDEKWKKDTTPATVLKSQTDFPWGDKWPPPKGSGNYSDDSRKAKAPNATVQYLENYDDGHPTTAPVMSYKPNKLGLYDLGGNVWEWCEDWYDNAQKDRVLRGGSWNLYDRGILLSSHRHHYTPGTRYNPNGFRCVMVPGGSPKSD